MGGVAAMRHGERLAGQDESTIVQLGEVAEPLCAARRRSHYEDGHGGNLFTLAGPDVLQR
jgi:hypothetical protein